MEHLNNNTSTGTDNKPIDEHEKERALEEMRDIIRRMREAERESPLATLKIVKCIDDLVSNYKNKDLAMLQP